MKTTFHHRSTGLVPVLVFGFCTCLAVSGQARDKDKDRDNARRAAESYALTERDFIVRREGNVVIMEPRQREMESDIRVQPVRPSPSYQVQSFPSAPGASPVPVERSSQGNRTLGSRIRSIFSNNETRREASSSIPIPAGVTVEVNGDRFTSTRSMTATRPSSSSNVNKIPPRDNVEKLGPGSGSTAYVSGEARQLLAEQEERHAVVSREIRNSSGETGRRSLEKRQGEEIVKQADDEAREENPTPENSTGATKKPLASLPDSATANATEKNSSSKKPGVKQPGERPVALPSGTAGVVKSPYPPHHSLDVRGLASGSLAKDPATGEIFKLP